MARTAVVPEAILLGPLSALLRRSLFAERLAALDSLLSFPISRVRAENTRKRAQALRAGRARNGRSGNNSDRVRSTRSRNQADQPPSTDYCHLLLFVTKITKATG
jgi:hypothetical protein